MLKPNRHVGTGHPKQEPRPLGLSKLYVSGLDTLGLNIAGKEEPNSVGDFSSAWHHGKHSPNCHRVPAKGAPACSSPYRLD